jgi:uncharacterized protein
MPDRKLIAVEVDQLILSNLGFAVLLKGVNDPRMLPIMIGGAESQSIAIALNNLQTPRPLTHDLIKNLLDYLECRLMRVELIDLKEGVFFARLVLERDGQRMDMDARPSDSIALALRAKAPIYVTPAIMDEAGQSLAQARQAGHQPDPHAADKRATPEESLQRSLAKAVQEERYEDAAKIRDELARIKKSAEGN